MPKTLLPVGIQSFSEIRSNNYIYVDKTKLVYKIITSGKPYFLSRPRRFGKSLLVSTLEALYRAKRELFKNLWIDSSDWAWEEYPVIRFDMSSIPNESATLLEGGLKESLRKIAQSYKITMNNNSPALTLLKELIELLREKFDRQVVVLIDEYDKPLLDQIKNVDICRKNREKLKGFYGILKSQDANIQLIFLTGVTKFSKVSIFSGLNNLDDLSTSEMASTLLGYTRQELDSNFSGHIEELAKKQNKTVEQAHQQIQHWYNGYQFSDIEEKVYNPFSVLLLLKHKKFKAHWFETGTPTFLLDLIEHEKFPIENIETTKVDSTTFSNFDIDTIESLPLLYQTGYLTIKQYDPKSGAYYLGYPNYEVEYGFISSLLAHYAKISKSSRDNALFNLADSLQEKAFDEFFELLKQFFAGLPYNLHIAKERFYHSILYFLLTSVGLKVGAEVETNKGRIDLVIELPATIYVVELKLDQSADIAIQQIKDNEYCQGLRLKNKEIYLMGVNFNTQSRNIDDCKIEEYS